MFTIRSKFDYATFANAGTLRACVLAAMLGVLGGAYHRLAPAAPSTFAGTAIAGAGRLDRISLTDHDGKARMLGDFKGKAVVVIFGDTHCPDLCPTTLADMARAMRRLGGDAARVQVLFVTLDPERDTRARLAQYVPSFYADFLGLYGDAAQTVKAAHAFGVFYQEQLGAMPGNYDLDHTAGSFVLDPKGELRLFLHYGIEPEKIAADIRRLLN